MTDDDRDDEQEQAERDKIAQIHDGFFQVMMGYPETPIALMKKVLPPMILDHLDLNSLEPCEAHFVSNEMRRVHSDKVYALKTKKGEETLVYALVEHQSKPHPMMAFRLLQYLVAIWAWWLRQNPEAKKLPPIIPMVIYNGRVQWQGPLDIRDLIAGPPELVDKTLAPFQLISVADLEPAELRDSAHLWGMLICLKHIFDEDFPLEEISFQLRDFPNPEALVVLFHHLVEYILEARNDVTMEDLTKVATSRLPIKEKDMKSTADMMREKASEKSRDETLVEVAKKMMQIGMEMTQIAAITGLPPARIQDLQQEIA